MPLNLAEWVAITGTDGEEGWLNWAHRLATAANVCFSLRPVHWRDEYDIALHLGVSKSIIKLILALAFMDCFVAALRALPAWRVIFTWLVRSF